MPYLEERQIPKSNSKTTYFPLTGGLNIEDPALTLKPGEVIASDNYEIGIRGRYRRMEGYERFDGSTLPSDATFYKISYTAGALEAGYSSGFSSGFSPVFNGLVGLSVTGDTSAANGHVLLSYETTSSRDQAGVGYLIITNVTGTFQDAEGLTFALLDAFSTGFSSGFE